MIAFCEGIQAAAPVDSYVTPEPWAMPGYDSDVIMAAGAFVQDLPLNSVQMGRSSLHTPFIFRVA